MDDSRWNWRWFIVVTAVVARDGGTGLQQMWADVCLKRHHNQQHHHHQHQHQLGGRPAPPFPRPLPFADWSCCALLKGFSRISVVI